MTAKPNKVLGRGLSNLLDASSDLTKKKADAGIIDIELGKIRPNPDNPRKKFDKTAIEELAQTIREHGLLQPILVQKEADYYLVVSGERRLRACRHLNLKTIPCIVKKLSPQSLLEISLIENIQREQLDAIEEAMVYKSLIDKFTLTQEQLSEKVGRNRVTIANRMRLLNLPDIIQAAIADGRLTEGQVRPLLAIKNETLQMKLFKEIESEKLSARQIEDNVRRYTEAGDKNNGKKSETKQDANILALVRLIEEHLNTRVKIQHNVKSKAGKITIDYFSLDDLEKMLKLIGVKK